jgi:hypothetical protein
VGGGDESQGLDASITIVPPPEVCVETVNWHLRGAKKIMIEYFAHFVCFVYNVTKVQLNEQSEQNE